MGKSLLSYSRVHLEPLHLVGGRLPHPSQFLHLDLQAPARVRMVRSACAEWSGQPGSDGQVSLGLNVGSACVRMVRSA